MDPIAIVQLVSAGLGMLATVAPEVAKVFTGGRPIEELTAEAIEKARALPVLTTVFDADLERRKQRDGDDS